MAVKGALKAIIKGADDVALVLVKKVGGDNVVIAIKLLSSKLDDAVPEIRKLIQGWAEDAAKKGSPNAAQFFAKMDEMINAAVREIKKYVDDFGKRVGGEVIESVSDDVITATGEITTKGQKALSVAERITKYDSIKNITSAPLASGTPSEILRQGLKNAGIKTPPYPNAAHHIVAAGAEAVSESAKKSQKILSDFGIDINSPANGVFLPYKRNDWVTSEAMHSGGHSKAYYEEVYSVLRNAVKDTKDMGLTGSSAQRYLCDTIQKLRERLLNGALQIHG